MTFNSRIISVSADAKETIITENGVSSVHSELVQNDIKRLFAVPDEDYKCSWPPHRICADVNGLFEEDWSTEQELAKLLDAETHTYVLCTSNLPAFFSFVYTTEHKNFTPVLMYGRQLIFGPRIDEQSSACSSCFVLNLLNNLPSLRARWKNKHKVIFPEQNLNVLKTAMETLLLIREASQPWHPPHSALILDIVSGKFSTEGNVLKLCQTCEGGSADIFHDYFNNPDELIGELLGGIKSISQVNSRPKSLVVVAAQSEIIPRRQLGGGVHYDFETAAKKAKFETMERLICANVFAQTVFQKAVDFNEDQVLPEDMYRPYSPDQFNTSSFPLERYDVNSNYYWLKGKRLKDEHPIWVPADFVSLDSRVSGNKLNPVTSNGTAIYESPHKALQNALLELVERDVVTRCWFKRALYTLDAAKLLPKAVGMLKNEGLEVKMMLCACTDHAPVVMVILYEKQQCIGAVGSGSGTDLFSASESALFNAATMFAYREQTDTKVDLKEVIEEHFAEAPNNYCVANWERIIKDYDPIVFDLSTDLLKKRNVYVVRAWSAIAVSFPNNGHPIPLNLWDPTEVELTNLKKEPNLF